ncbi:protein-tyrosine phosphatase [Actinokineospora baliensis]|uniref:tyrosine-protein phosphatase n=1 Tax=Actinokineospora baliensis TaxID=547056 RepID=UPI00195E2909|nr:tyrosine-protein phosphatase [Actinokineospora baliensis]MBM7773230.1 protein-tyrosine phosphatase [Actinokineospora baliensis]
MAEGVGGVGTQGSVPERHIRFERLRNFRDLGGYPTADGGTVRWQAVYRADTLGKLRGADWSRFLELGIRSVVDLRYPWEVERDGAVPEVERFDYVNLSIEHRPYDQAATDPDIDPWRFLADRAAEVVEDGAGEIRLAIEHIADARGPVVVHCTSGKDRTGLVAAFLLTLLGVDRAQVLDDFALTELASAHLLADWQAAYPDKTMRWPFYGRAPATVMDHVLTDLADRYGSVHGYLADRVGISDATVARLRKRLIVQPKVT